MRLEHIEIERLSVSPVNMRAKQKDPELDNILPSIRERGVLVPLLVRPAPEPEHFEIVAGRRRYSAAKVIAEERGETILLPCAIMEAGDDASALEASLIENFARLDPDEVTQWETFARLVKQGKGVEDIAATFGVTDRLVRRILALGNLLPRIRTIYRKGQIDATTVRHLTLATVAQQREWLGLFENPDTYAPMGRVLKDWLFGGDAIPTKVALFDLSEYPAPIVTDLFGEDSYFSDGDAFWKLQRDAIEAKRQSLLDEGWEAVEVLEPGAYFQQWGFEKRSRTKGGKVYISLSARGEVEFHEGWLPRKEAQRGKHSDAPPMPRREITNALRNYIDLHRHAAVRATLIGHPQVALRLALAHAISGSILWSVKADNQRAEKPATANSIKASAAEALFDEKRRGVLALLGFEGEDATVLGLGGMNGVTSLFQRLLELPDEQVLEVQAVAMGEALASGSPAVDAVGQHLGVDMHSLWQPDDAFFELIRDKDVLTAMVTEVAGPEVASGNAGAKGSTLKAVIRDCLDGENGRTKIDGWLPAWMRFPAENYTARGEEPHEEAKLDEAA